MRLFLCIAPAACRKESTSVIQIMHECRHYMYHTTANVESCRLGHVAINESSKWPVCVFDVLYSLLQMVFRAVISYIAATNGSNYTCVTSLVCFYSLSIPTLDVALAAVRTDLTRSQSSSCSSNAGLKIPHVNNVSAVSDFMLATLQSPVRHMKEYSFSLGILRYSWTIPPNTLAHVVPPRCFPPCARVPGDFS